MEARGIYTSNKEKVLAAVMQMWESEYFMEKDLTNWEKKPTVNKIWAKVQTYFKGLYNDKNSLQPPKPGSPDSGKQSAMLGNRGKPVLMSSGQTMTTPQGRRERERVK